MGAVVSRAVPWLLGLVGVSIIEKGAGDVRDTAQHIKPWAPVVGLGLIVWAYSIYRKG